ncbi:anthranilate synthase component I [Ktedonospora formicarum]|uniref:Anthranilate synthase component 1 n=1 Tax=Ktedonospora formicarum TaxID=2778364 RepID=A0A8J3HYM3_9CHLR|nr:anthranilate synthase component I [Ktedonospora formicarum]GHO45561.1 anthranilate synthase component I [Ktedonospora formicarum]
MSTLYSPSLPTIRRLHDLETGNQDVSKSRPLLPLYCDILADMETPVSAYCKTAQNPYSFLLESVTGGEQVARYSFIGIDPYMVMIHRDETATLLKMNKDAHGDMVTRREEIPCHDPLTLIEQELGQFRLVTPPDMAPNELPKFFGGSVGYLSYEAVSRFERAPVPERNTLDLPVAVIIFTETVLVFDHVRQRVRVITHMHLDAPDMEAEYQRACAILEDVQQRLRQPARVPLPEPGVLIAEPEPWTSNRTQEEFEGMVRRSVEYIRAGDVFQVVPSQRFSRRIQADPFTVYRALRTVNPSPYMFYLDLKDFHIVGASPELLVRYEDEEVTIRPIAGTRPRGGDYLEDQRLAEELTQDPKERAEHVMLVDLGRNDVGRVSVPGSVKVDEFLTIERYSHVMHLVSNVTGKLRDDATPFEALRSGFPAGTVSGAPKVRAMEIISELEGDQRGVYAGAVGYFSHNGNQETAIALRTMVIKDGVAYIQAGCGIVADSDPASEYQESLNKARSSMRAVDEAEKITREYLQAHVETVAQRSGKEQ